MHLSKEVIQKKLLLWSKLYPSYLKIDFTIVKLTADAVALAMGFIKDSLLQNLVWNNQGTVP